MDVERAFYILHFNDVYDIEEQMREPKGGAARFLYTLNLLKSKLQQTITLFSGDIFSPSSLSNLYHGQQMVYPFQQFKVDVACLGNHDFDYALPELAKLLQQSNTPWLLSNVFNSQTNNNLADALPYLILKVGSLKLGFFGLAEEEWLGQITEIPSNIIEYQDYLQCAEKMSIFLREEKQCDIIIALTHMRVPNDQHLIRSLKPGLIDMVLGGHDHFWFREKVKQTLLAKSGTNFRNIGLFRVSVEQSGTKQWYEELTREFEKYNVKLEEVIHYELQSEYHTLYIDLLPIDLYESIPKDPNMDLFVSEKISSYNKETLKTLGHTATDLETRFSLVRCVETNAANLFADILRYEYNSDIAVINTGTMRSDELLHAGRITYQTIDKIFAIPDYVVSYRITGKDIHYLLENSVSKLPSADGRFLGISGITFKYKISKPGMNRINKNDIFVGGEVLDYEKIYKIVTKSFIAEGFDGYKAVKEEDFYFDKTMGIPIKSIFIQFFETVRKHPSLRKLSSENQEELQKIQMEELQFEKSDDQHEILLDKRLTKFRPIISNILIEENEPYLVVNPQVEGRIIILD